MFGLMDSCMMCQHTEDELLRLATLTSNAGQDHKFHKISNCFFFIGANRWPMEYCDPILWHTNIDGCIDGIRTKQIWHVFGSVRSVCCANSHFSIILCSAKHEQSGPMRMSLPTEHCVRFTDLSFFMHIFLINGSSYCFY